MHSVLLLSPDENAQKSNTCSRLRSKIKRVKAQVLVSPVFVFTDAVYWYDYRGSRCGWVEVPLTSKLSVELAPNHSASSFVVTFQQTASANTKTGDTSTCELRLTKKKEENWSANLPLCLRPAHRFPRASFGTVFWRIIRGYSANSTSPWRRVGLQARGSPSHNPATNVDSQ